MSKPSPTDRREQHRISFRTAVTIISLDRSTDQIRPVLTDAWTEDVSLSGALIITKAAVEEGKVWMRFHVAGIGERLVEAEILRQTQRPSGYFHNKEETLYFYGLKFFRVVEEPGIVRWLVQTIRGETPQFVPVRIRKRYQAMQAEK